MREPGEGPPMLSIGILVGREADWLARCLDDLPPIEAPKLVVTNFDLDATRRLCGERGVSFHVFSPGGAFSFARQRNALFEHCRTPWILMLDVDETISGSHLKTALALSRRPPERAFVPRHSFLGPSGLLLSDEQPRLLPGDGRFAFEGHVANTLEAEHERGEVLLPANFEILDRGAVWDERRMAARRSRFLELARHEQSRLLALSRARDRSSWCRIGFREHVMGHDLRAAVFLRAFARDAEVSPTASYLLARVEERTLPDGAERALARLSRLAECGAADYRIYRALARLHRARRDFGSLRRSAEQALRVHPECAVFHHQLAVACHGQGDLDGAALAHAESLRLDPGLRPARTLGRALELSLEVPA
jgi:hypothetical protein